MTSKKEKKQGVELSDAHRDYAEGMTSYSFFKTNNKETSDDLVQDTFAKTWSFLIRGGNVITMRAFLYHTLNHLIIDEYRKKKSVSLDNMIENGREPSSDMSRKNWNIFDGKVAFLMIKLLPIKYRKIMKMRYGQDLSHREISNATGQSRTTVAVQAHRGLALLKGIYHRTNK